MEWEQRFITLLSCQKKKIKIKIKKKNSKYSSLPCWHQKHLTQKSDCERWNAVHAVSSLSQTVVTVFKWQYVDEASQSSRSWHFLVMYRRKVDVFQFCEDVSPLIQEASSVLTSWRGAAGFYTLYGSVLTEAVWTLTVRVVMATRGLLWLGEPSHHSHLSSHFSWRTLCLHSHTGFKSLQLPSS